MATSQENGTHHSQETECLAFIQSLVSQTIGFKFHLSSGGFTCTFDFNGAVATNTARTTAAVVKSQKSPSTRRRNEKRCPFYLESKRGGPTSGQDPQSVETHSKVTASDPRRINEEVEENGEVDTGKALVTGTDDTTSFNASLDLNPRSIHLLRSGLGRSANSLESSEADTSSSSMVVKEVVEVKEAAEVNTPDHHPRPFARVRDRCRERLAQGAVHI